MSRPGPCICCTAQGRDVPAQIKVIKKQGVGYFLSFWFGD